MRTGLALRFVGTDARLMAGDIPHMGWKWRLKAKFLRFYYKLMDKVVDEIYVDDWNLKDYLRTGGLRSKVFEVRDELKYTNKYARHKTSTLNVLYFNPTIHKKNKKSIRWIYG